MWPLLLSVVIHVSIFMALNNGKASNKGHDKGNKSSSKVNVLILDKPSDKEVESKKQPSKSKSTLIVKKKIPLKQEYVNHECTIWYGGIGIQHPNGGSYAVEAVGKGYPAERAGILIGDLIINGEELRGEPGTYVTVKILRGTKALSIEVVREKICTKDTKAP